MEYPISFEVSKEDLPMIEAFAKWVDICELMPAITDPEIQKLLMDASCLRTGPAGVSKTDVILKLAEEGKIKIETITIPVPEAWKEIQTVIEDE
jgi:hypothetical protein